MNRTVFLASCVHLDGIDAPRGKRGSVDILVIEGALVASAGLRMWRRVYAANDGAAARPCTKARIEELLPNPNLRPLLWTYATVAASPNGNFCGSGTIDPLEPRGAGTLHLLLPGMPENWAHVGQPSSSQRIS